MKKRLQTGAFLYNIPTVYVYYISAFFRFFFFYFESGKSTLIYIYICARIKKKKKKLFLWFGHIFRLICLRGQKYRLRGTSPDPQARVGTHPHPNPHAHATAKPLFCPSNALKLFGGVIICRTQKKRAIGRSHEKSKSAQNLHICKKSSNFAAETKTQEKNGNGNQIR